MKQRDRRRRRLRIAYVIGSMGAGGAEGQVVELMRGLRDRGHLVKLLLLHAEGPRLDALRREGFDIFDIRLPRLRPLRDIPGKFRLAAALWRTLRALRRFRPHILHSWLFEADAWAALAKVCGAPGVFITSRRSMGCFKDKAPWKQRVQNLYNRVSRRVICNSQMVASDALARERNLPKLDVIHNGVDVERYHPDESMAGTKQAVITIANLFRYKGYFELLDAWSLLRKRGIEARLLCVGGDGDSGPQIRRRAAELGLGDSVSFLGSRGDIPDLLRGPQVFVLASHEEGFSNAVLEAMACGLPVVASRVGGIPEAVVDGETGYLTPARNAEQLAAKLEILLKDQVLARRMGAAGRERILREFTPLRCLQSHLQLYHRLASPRAS